MARCVKLFCLLVSFLYAESASGYVSYHHKKNYKYHKGYLVTNENDTVRGSIKFDATFKEVLIYSGTRVKFSGIKYLNLAGADPKFNRNTCTEFFCIARRPGIWRRVYSGTKYQCFDNSLYVDEAKGNVGTTFIVYENAAEKGFEITPFLLSVKKSLLNFFLKKTGQEVPKKKFERFIDVLQYFDNL